MLITRSRSGSQGYSRKASVVSATPLSSASAPIETVLPGVDLDALTVWLESESLIPADLSAASTRELRVLCNESYGDLETKLPPYGAPTNYAAVVAEIEKRELHAEGQFESHHCG